MVEISLARSIILVVFLVSIARATDVPATAPAKPDLSTPKAALEAFFGGIRRADAKAIAEAIDAPDTAHEKLASQYAQAVIEREGLRRAIASKFGPGAAPADAWIPTDSQIQAAQVERHGEHATVKLPSGMGDVVKSNGRWTVPLLDSIASTEIDHVLKAIREYIAGVKAATADVKDGRIKSAADATQLFAKFPFPAVAVTQ
jgi:hypothetical protein